MSVVNGIVITAFNFMIRERDRPMIVTDIIQYDATEPGRPARFRLKGVDAESNDPLSKFCTLEYANMVSKELNIPINVKPH